MDIDLSPQTGQADFVTRGHKGEIAPRNITHYSCNNTLNYGKLVDMTGSRLPSTKYLAHSTKNRAPVITWIDRWVGEVF